MLSTNPLVRINSLEVFSLVKYLSYTTEDIYPLKRVKKADRKLSIAILSVICLEYIRYLNSLQFIVTLSNSSCLVKV